MVATFYSYLREAPADAEVASHKLLVRAGYIRQLGAGIYSFLFLGNRSTQKIMGIVREEMDKIGQEFYLPALNPRDIWEESGRWAAMGENMFRLKDRKGADLCLGMTHEEVMTDIARKELRSYKQLPQIWYQIQTKFRDEPRPKSGLLRVRQFIMKDAYSFDMDAAGLDVSYKQALRDLLPHLRSLRAEVHGGRGRLGSDGREGIARVHGADSGGRRSDCELRRLQLRGEPGEGYIEAGAVADLAAEGDGKPLEVHTPGQKTIEDVAKFLGVSPKNKIKTLALMAEEPVADKRDEKTGKTNCTPSWCCCAATIS